MQNLIPLPCITNYRLQTQDGRCRNYMYLVWLPAAQNRGKVGVKYIRSPFAEESFRVKRPSGRGGTVSDFFLRVCSLT